MRHRLEERFGESTEKFIAGVAFEGEQFFVGVDHVACRKLHPGQLALDHEDERVEQAFEVVSAAEGQSGVGGAAAEAQ